MPRKRAEMRVRAGEATEEEKDRIKPRTYGHATTYHKPRSASGLPRSAASSPARLQLVLLNLIGLAYPSAASDSRELGSPQRTFCIQ